MRAIPHPFHVGFEIDVNVRVRPKAERIKFPGNCAEAETFSVKTEPTDVQGNQPFCSLPRRRNG